MCLPTNGTLDEDGFFGPEDAQVVHRHTRHQDADGHAQLHGPRDDGGGHEKHADDEESHGQNYPNLPRKLSSSENWLPGIIFRDQVQC